MLKLHYPLGQVGHLSPGAAVGNELLALRLLGAPFEGEPVAKILILTSVSGYLGALKAGSTKNMITNHKVINQKKSFWK